MIFIPGEFILLMVRPVIVKLDRSIEFKEVSLHRHINCERYERCLLKAGKKDWEGFSCIKCPIFKEYIRIRKKFESEFSVKSGVRND